MVDLKTAWDVALWRWSRPNPNIKCFTGGNFAGFLTFGYIGERAMWARETRQRYRLRIWKCASCRFFLSTLNVAHFPNINDVTHAEVTEPTEFPRPRISIPVHLSRNPARNNTEHQLPRPIYLVHLFSGWSLVVRGPPPLPGAMWKPLLIVSLLSRDGWRCISVVGHSLSSIRFGEN